MSILCYDTSFWFKHRRVTDLVLIVALIHIAVYSAHLARKMLKISGRDIELKLRPIFYMLAVTFMAQVTSLIMAALSAAGMILFDWFLWSGQLTNFLILCIMVIYQRYPAFFLELEQEIK